MKMKPITIFSNTFFVYFLNVWLQGMNYYFYSDFDTKVDKCKLLLTLFANDRENEILPHKSLRLREKQEELENR